MICKTCPSSLHPRSHLGMMPSKPLRRDSCGRVLMGLLCHASARISSTTSHMLLTHAVCLEPEALQLLCSNASIRRGVADALVAAALALVGHIPASALEIE